MPGYDRRLCIDIGTALNDAIPISNGFRVARRSKSEKICIRVYVRNCIRRVAKPKPNNPVTVKEKVFGSGT